MTVKKVRVMRFTLKHALNDVEEQVNGEIDRLTAEGSKIISITPMMVPSTPLYVVYNIIYEENGLSEGR
jgi:hypothetical protein